MSRGPLANTKQVITESSKKRPISPEQAEKITSKSKKECTREFDDTVCTLTFPENFGNRPSAAGHKNTMHGTGDQNMSVQDLIETWRTTLAAHRVESKADMICIMTEVTNGMLGRIADLETEVAKQNQELEGLYYRIDTLEQNSRAKNAKFAGIKEEEDEDVKAIVIDVAKKIGVTIKESDITECERVGKPPTETNQRPRNIMTKFASIGVKAGLFKMRKSLGTSTDSYLKSIFINEDLAPLRAKLLYIARMLKNDGKINKYWIFRNEVQVKLTELDEPTPVRSMDFFSDFHDHKVFQDILRPKFIPQKPVSAMSIFKSKPGYAEALRKLHEMYGEEYFDTM
jgi:hypothetical protein